MNAENKNKIDLFLDSGAFSAWTRGAKIDIQEYIAFIKKYQDSISLYANLDVIGNPEASWENQKIMESAGLKPLPCYHYGEDKKWLIKYLDHYDYIALGGMVRTTSSKKLVLWLDEAFSKFICDKDGLPKVKTHGFGLTSFNLMLRYPWYSVDSTSWVVTGRLGSVFVPRFRKGSWIYDKPSWKICVSSRSPNKSEAGKHIDSFSPIQKDIIFSYFDSKGYKLGKSEFHTEKVDYELKQGEKWFGKALGGLREVEVILEPGLCNDFRFRDELNVIYFVDLEKTIPPYPRRFQIRKSGFGFDL